MTSNDLSVSPVRATADGEIRPGRRFVSDRVAVGFGSVLGIVVVGAIAIPRLGDHPLWLDEAYSLGVVNQFAYAVRHTGGTMVGYYALLWLWTRVAESPAWLRSMSLLFAWATMPVVALLGRRIGGRPLAVLAPPLLGSAYMFQAAAIETRAYALEILLVTTCWYVLIRAVEEGTDTVRAKPWWVVFTLIAPWGIFLHGLYALFLAAMFAAALLAPRPRSMVLRMLPAFGAAAVLLGLLFWLGVSSVGDWVPETTFEYAKTTIYRFLGWRRPLRWLTMVAIAGLGVWVVVQRLRLSRANHNDPSSRLDNWRSTVPIVWLGLPPILLILISLVRPEFIGRYFVAVTPGLALAFGLALCKMTTGLARLLGLPECRAVALVGIVGVVVIAGWVTTTVRDTDPGSRAHWDEIAALVASRSEPGDGILLYSDLSRPPFESAWANVPTPVEPEVLSMPRPLGEVRRFDAREPWTDATLDRINDHERVWSIDVANVELGAAFYQLSGPLPENYRIQRVWKFPGRVGPLTVRLYVRDPDKDS